MYVHDSRILLCRGYLRQTIYLIIISLKMHLSSSWYSCNIAELALNNNHSITHPYIYLQLILSMFINNGLFFYMLLYRLSINNYKE
jgi:hypothetical protein